MTQPAASARDAATQIIRSLTQQGHTAYLAGGCVRDTLLGKAPKDYDVVTDATPDQVQALFPRRSAAVGAAFGVVIVYTPQTTPRHRWITEVATFRAESSYSDGRRPDAVRFTNAEEDAKRRDFTINGLFAQPDPGALDDPASDRVIDYVDGRADLDASVIRAIGDPDERFGEDYLRMLRAVRFAARLGFAIDPKTSAAIRVHARYLGQISRERIGQELLAMLQGPAPTLALDLLQQHKLDAPTLNEDPLETALTVSQRLTDKADTPARLAAWMIDRHGLLNADQDRIVARWRKALSLSNDHRDALNRLLALIHTLSDWPTLPNPARKRLAVRDAWQQALVLWQALGHDAQQIKNDVQALANDGIGLAPPPLLCGDDLIHKGLQPGPTFKTLLDLAYDQQLEGGVNDRDQALGWLDSQLPQG